MDRFIERCKLEKKRQEVIDGTSRNLTNGIACSVRLANQLMP